MASQAFDNVFSSTYKAYQVVIEYFWAAAQNDDTHIQFRYAGPTTYTSNYFGPAFTLSYTGSLTTANMNGTAAVVIGLDSGATADNLSGNLFFTNVGQVAERPYCYAETYNSLNASAQWSYAYNSSAGNNVTGFLIKSSSSNVTGAVAVYGLASA